MTLALLWYLKVMLVKGGGVFHLRHSVDGTTDNVPTHVVHDFGLSATIGSNYKKDVGVAIWTHRM